MSDVLSPLGSQTVPMPQSQHFSANSHTLLISQEDSLHTEFLCVIHKLKSSKINLPVCSSLTRGLPKILFTVLLLQVWLLQQMSSNYHCFRVLGPRKTTENLDRVGQSQDFLDANWLLASSPALNTRALALVPICAFFFPFPPTFSFLWKHLQVFFTNNLDKHQTVFNTCGRNECI
jgi:hypothetical protein